MEEMEVIIQVISLIKKFRFKNPYIKKSGCEYDHWIGDGYCDDINNNMNCSYDGGDCCGPVINTYYCMDCQCCDASGCNGTTANEGKYYS